MAGRPPSEKTFANMLRVAIKEAHEDGKDRLRMVADALVTKAMTGDVAAIREVADRLDGKAVQQLDVDATVRRIEDLIGEL
jgi:ribosomal protein L17